VLALEADGGARLAHEAREHFRAKLRLGGKAFDGDDISELKVLRRDDVSHAPAAEQPKNAVFPADDLPRGGSVTRSVRHPDTIVRRRWQKGDSRCTLVEGPSWH
jgi:hypothetical protein